MFSSINTVLQDFNYFAGIYMYGIPLNMVAKAMCAATIEFVRSPAMAGLNDIRFVMMGRDATQQVQSEFFNNLLVESNLFEMNNSPCVVADYDNYSKRRKKKSAKNNYAEYSDQKKADLPESNIDNYPYFV